MLSQHRNYFRELSKYFMHVWCALKNVLPMLSVRKKIRVPYVYFNIQRIRFFIIFSFYYHSSTNYTKWCENMWWYTTAVTLINRYNIKYGWKVWQNCSAKKKRRLYWKKGDWVMETVFQCARDAGGGGMAGGRREQYSRSRQHLNNSTGVKWTGQLRIRNTKT
jgi:hypothetical protein